MATDQCKKALCQIVTEFILPELWNITKLPGNYEAPELLVSLFEVLAFRSSTSISHEVQFKELFKDLRCVLECHFADKFVLLKFLGQLWCKPPHRGEESVSALLQVQCLHIANACLCSVSGKTLKEVSKLTCTVLPSLLVPLCSPILYLQ